MNNVPDRIEKRILLKTSRGHVWRAVSEAKRFGTWFGVEFESEFVAGQAISARIAPTQVDREVAAMQEPLRGMAFEWFVERIEPMTSIAFRWHPFAVDRSHDYSDEPTTLIEFVLEEADGGILLTITESGFDRIPVARRAAAFQANESGWEKQTMLVAKYLAMAD